MMETTKKFPGYLWVAFLTFIGSSYLGALLGALLPSIRRAFELEYSTASAFLSFGNLGAFIGIIVVSSLIYRYQIRSLALCTWLFGIFICLLALVVTKPWIFPLALGIGALVAAAQSVASLLILYGSELRYRSRNFCGLHCMFGLGSFLAPFAATAVAKGDLSWQRSISLASLLFTVAIALTLLLFPKQKSLVKRKFKKLSIDVFKVMTLLILLLYITAQVLVVEWMVSFLNTGLLLNTASANKYLALYFGIVTFSRFIFYLILHDKIELWVMNFSICLTSVFLIIGHSWPLRLSLSGINSPFYSIFLGRMSRRFSDSAEHMTLLVLLCAQVSLSCTNLLLGGLADFIGIKKAFWLPTILMIFATIFFNLFELRWKKLEEGLSQKR